MYNYIKKISGSVFKKKIVIFLYYGLTMEFYIERKMNTKLKLSLIHLVGEKCYGRCGKQIKED